MSNAISASKYRGEEGEKYFAHRKYARDEAVQAQRAQLYAGLTTANDAVLDFGCGTGGVLSRVAARYRVGVEISEAAAEVARQRLDVVVPDLANLDTASFDAAISFHALEHVLDPSHQIHQIKRVLRPGGRIRLIVPAEDIVLNRLHRSWREDDPDQHLFTWTPLLFGNLLRSLGFKDIRCTLSPISSGGRLKHVIGHKAATWFKALRRGQIQIIADASTAK